MFQVPVGPVHAGIIEPGHFLFSVAGEPVLYLQLRMFYVHKGIEKLFETLPVAHGVRLAESISGDSSFAHATAFCHALERAAGMEAPPRARALRTLCLELERLYNHVADLGAICTDVAFVTANMHAMRLKESVLRLNEELTGNRLLRGMACPGGVRFDFDAGQLRALAALADEFEKEVRELVELIRTNSGARDRFETTGVLKPEVAANLGIVGIAGRASGFDHDLRRDIPHDFYDQVQFTVPVFTEGDVRRRMIVRREEIFQSLGIIRQVLAKLPAGPIAAPTSAKCRPDRVALGYVEGWRGRDFSLDPHRPRQPAGPLQGQGPLAAKLAGADRGHFGQHHPGFPGSQQEFQPLLFRDGPLIMFDIIRQSLKTGIVTTRYPAAPPRLSARARGRPEIDWAELEGRPARRGRVPHRRHLLRGRRRAGAPPGSTWASAFSAAFAPRRPRRSA